MAQTSNLVLSSFISKFSTIDFFKDIINISLYPSEFTSTVGINEQESIPKYLNKFFSDLYNLSVKINHIDKNNLKKYIDCSKSLLTIRNQGQGLLTYETIGQHYTSTNALVKKLIESSISDKIQTEEEFRQKINNIVLNINYYYDFLHAIQSMTEINTFISNIERPETSIVEVVEKYKTMALQMNADLSKLNTVNHAETAVDYYTMDNEQSVRDISDTISEYIMDHYAFYSCGLKAYDDSVSGFESSSVHIIASPSNGGKSMTLANLFWRIAINNKDEFTDKDVALYITCEDDIIKTTRKFMSIFGNYDYQEIRNLFKKVHEFFSEVKKNDSPELTKSAQNTISDLFKGILDESIVKTTKGNLKIVFKYAPENTFSAGDLTRQIETYKMQGINVKYVIIDYLDVMKPTLAIGDSQSDDYNKLGIITQELRTLSRLYGVPVITASQTTREGDNVQRTMTNSQMGESWKKVKFSDFIYMQRIRHDLNIFDEDVKDDVYNKDSKDYGTSDSLKIIELEKELTKNLLPIEMTVTKSKEQGRGYSRYLLFCTKNLRIYNYIDEYIKDMIEFEKLNNALRMKIKNTINLAMLNNEVMNDIIELDEDAEIHQTLRNNIKELI